MGGFYFYRLRTLLLCVESGLHKHRFALLFILIFETLKLSCMVRVVVIGLLLLNIGLVNCIQAQDKPTVFRKAHFYKVMESGTETELNNELELVQSADLSGKAAFEGALLMKKASVVKGAKRKLDLFKAGHQKLEAVLKKDSSNAEARFLRLMIQEHAPGIVHYKTQLANDRLYVLNNFDKLSTPVQQAIKEYSKQSTILKPADF